jgi:LPXTG-motif cell wall-anchored protein
MLHIRKPLLFVLIILVVAVPMASAQVTPGVTVNDQPIVNGTVMVESVVSDGAGWIVIHTQADGKPGPIIGYAQVNAGMNSDVVVEVDGSAATDTLYAMLHTDAGQVGTYEFPGDDSPVKAGDIVIAPAFFVSGTPTALPETGGQSFPWSLLLAITGLVALMGGAGLVLGHRIRHTKFFS